MLNGEKTYPLDAKDQDGRSVVHLACFLDAPIAEEMLKELISHGANVNCRDESGNTPLHVIYHLNALEIYYFVESKINMFIVWCSMRLAISQCQ